MPNGSTHPAVMRDWWVPNGGGGDGAVTIASFFLVLGGIVGGATVAGAEWRYGTVATLLTWEPRRLRVHVSRTAACAVLAFVIALALQVVFLASFLPAALLHGSTANLDADWWVALGAVMVRTSLLTAITAMLGVALATLGRNTAIRARDRLRVDRRRGRHDSRAQAGSGSLLVGREHDDRPRLGADRQRAVSPWSGGRVVVGGVVLVGARGGSHVGVSAPRCCERVVMSALRSLLWLTIGISVTMMGLSLTLAFGVLVFLGMPMLAVGLGLLSAAIDEIEGG